jgi:methionyl aminopeptidase
LIGLKTVAEIEQMRESGRIVAQAIEAMAEAVAPGVTTAELDAIAVDIVANAGATASFLNYRGYPASTCLSINEEVIHGIPSSKRVLKEGDIIDLDIGVCLNGWHADSALTVPVGSISTDLQRLLAVTKECLAQGIAKARPGNRLGDIGFVVQRYAESNRYGVVREMVGHGIGRALHEEPSVPNYGKPKTGYKIEPGMTFCIEPMINLGTHKVITLDDGWTIVTTDGKPSAHFEHTIAITDSGPILLTIL